MYSIKCIEALPNCFHITVRYGYNQPMVPSDLAGSIESYLRNYVTSHRIASGFPNDSVSTSEITDKGPSRSVTAYDSKEVVYIIGSQELKILPRTNIFVGLVLNAFIWIRNLSRSKITQMDVLPTDDLVDLGFVKEI